MRSRRSFTLLEVVISLSLTGFLLFILIGSFTHTSAFRIKLEKAKREVHARVHVQERLTALFSSLCWESEEGEQTESVFYTDRDSSLYFLFDNGLEEKDSFSGKVRAKLFLDPKHKLQLIITGKRGEQRKELLAENIAALSWQFFDSVGRKRTASWSKESLDLPALVFLTLSSDSSAKKKSAAQREFRFGFILLNPDSIIEYRALSTDLPVREKS